jgi:TctA family transporter
LSGPAHAASRSKPFIIQGITPGPDVITEQPALFWGLIASMWVGNVDLTTLAGAAWLVGCGGVCSSVPGDAIFLDRRAKRRGSAASSRRRS